MTIDQNENRKLILSKGILTDSNGNHGARGREISRTRNDVLYWNGMTWIKEKAKAKEFDSREDVEQDIETAAQR